MASPNSWKRTRDGSCAALDFLRQHVARNGDVKAPAFAACKKLTNEQLEAVKQVRTPQAIKEDPLGGRITIILAAAASGKTTTMLALVKVLYAFGHGTKEGEYALFAMFNKNAAVDGNKRLSLDSEPAIQKSVRLCTSHSAALTCCSALNKNVSFKESGQWKGPPNAEWRCERMSQADVEQYVLRHCRREIHDFVLAGAQAGRDVKSRKRLVRDEELCAFWIYKTWLGWVQKAGTLEDLGPSNIDPITKIGKLTYYPIIKNHQQGSDGDGSDGNAAAAKKKKKKKRLSGTHPGTFYTAQAKELWERMMNERLFVSDDAYLKFAQLTKERFGNFDSILLDESQDLTECQVELFVVNQTQADIYIVGDAVQSLYSWRGAQPKQLRELGKKRVAPRTVNDGLALTESHRFGPGIANIANHLLFIKRHSAQHILWHHYAIRGVGPPTLSISDAPLSGKRTVVGRTNAGLFREGIQLLAADQKANIGLLGQAAYAQFETLCKELLQLLPHYKEETAFKFKGAEYDSWEDFEEEVEYREMPYTTHLSLLNQYGEGGQAGELPELITTFRTCVIERQLPESECEVLLVTACGAKGLEWDQVTVLDDYLRLMVFERVPAEELQPGKDYARIHTEGPSGSGSGAPASSTAVPMRFKLTNDWKGDELNNWYVAVTRARLRLQLPKRFMHLHSALWEGTGFTQDPEDAKAPEYTAQEIHGINALLAKMGRAISPPGPEFHGSDDQQQGGASTSQAGVIALMSPGPSSSGAAVQPAGATGATPGMRSLNFAAACS